MKKLIIVGAGGRDFHNFNPGIDDRIYPPALAGQRACSRQKAGFRETVKVAP